MRHLKLLYECMYDKYSHDTAFRYSWFLENKVIYKNLFQVKSCT